MTDEPSSTKPSSTEPSSTEPIRWITAVLEVQGERFDAELGFWLAATGGALGARRDPGGEDAIVVPPGGDAYLRLHRRPEGARPRVRLCLHAADVMALASSAVRLGATRAGEGHDLDLTSPGGLRFSIVEHRREGSSARPHEDALLDQVCLDIPSSRHEAECAFWAALSGWEHLPESPQEFSELSRPVGMPLRLLMQRLGEVDGGVRAHLDLAADGSRQEVAARHVGRGAVLTSTRRGWQVLVDPAGLSYCVTGRDPVTGR